MILSQSTDFSLFATAQIKLKLARDRLSRFEGCNPRR